MPKIFFFLFLLLFSCGIDVEKKSGNEKCVWCSMSISKYPLFRTAKRVGADFSDVSCSPRCLFFAKESQKLPSDGSYYFTEYYSKSLLAGDKLFFVQGSDVVGPMGAELIPLKDSLSAVEFMNDHKGKKILRFHQIDEKFLQELR
jgi:hypothetical protein